MLISPYHKPWLTPKSGSHPRLMVRKSRLNELRANVEKEKDSNAYHFYQQLLGLRLTCIGGTPEKGTFDLHEYLSVEARAFRALLSGKKEDAEDAIQILFFLLENSSFAAGIMKARYSGHLIFISAQVYDWCYDYLSEEQKQFIIEKCEWFAAEYFEMGYPPVKQGAVTGHGGEAQLLRDLLAFSIAVYDERPDIYTFCAGRIFDEFVPNNEYMLGCGYHHDGPAYGSYRYTCLLWSALLFYTMSGKKAYSQTVDRVADSFLYCTRPDGESIRIGDEFNEKKAEYSRNAPFAVPMFLAAAYTGNARYWEEYEKSEKYTEYLLPSQRGDDYYRHGSFGEGLFSPVVYLMWRHLTPIKPAEPLLPYRYFGSPVGLTIFNDGERVVLMKIGELCASPYGSHDHMDTGCFQVYYKGALATDSGLYDNYCSQHRYCYAVRTSAHNCLTVFDPQKPVWDGWKEEKWGPFCYDGGVRFVGGVRNMSQWMQCNRMATVLSHTESDELCELVGDLTEAYADRCERVIRKMRFEPEAGMHGILTVEDEIITKSAEFITGFHLHMQEEPEIKDNTVIIRHKGGKLICHVEEPEDFKIEVVGGEGKEYLIDGIDFATERGNGFTEGGWGQVLISSKNQTTHTKFKIRMEIGDDAL